MTYHILTALVIVGGCWIASNVAALVNNPNAFKE